MRLCLHCEIRGIACIIINLPDGHVAGMAYEAAWLCYVRVVDDKLLRSNITCNIFPAAATLEITFSHASFFKCLPISVSSPPNSPAWSLVMLNAYKRERRELKLVLWAGRSWLVTCISAQRRKFIVNVFHRKSDFFPENFNLESTPDPPAPP